MLYQRGKAKMWWFRFRFGGRIVHESARTLSKTVAREAEHQRRRQLEESFNQITRRTLPPPFAKAAAEWMAGRETRVAAATLRIGRESLKHLLPVFGSKLLCDILPREIAAYQQTRVREGAQGRTVNIEVQSLCQVIKWAKCWMHLIGEVHPLKERESIGKALAPEEESRLLAECAAADSACYTAVVLALNTTMRKDEIRKLRWNQIDLFQGVLTVGKSKTDAGTGRTIPLNQSAVRSLADWASAFPDRQPAHFVFPACESHHVDPLQPTKGWRTAWRNACKRAGLKLRFHDLRHTAITKLAESQASDQTIMSVAGHVSREMLERYSHIRMAAKRVALDSIATPLPEPAEGKAPVFQGDVHQIGNQIQVHQNESGRKLLN